MQTNLNYKLSIGVIDTMPKNLSIVISAFWIHSSISSMNES